MRSKADKSHPGIRVFITLLKLMDEKLLGLNERETKLTAKYHKFTNFDLIVSKHNNRDTQQVRSATKHVDIHSKMRRYT